MAIRAVRAVLDNRLAVTTRIIALAFQFVMARDGAAQQATAQPIPLMDRQREIALALGTCPSTVAEQTGVYLWRSAKR